MTVDEIIRKALAAHRATSFPRRVLGVDSYRYSCECGRADGRSVGASDLAREIEAHLADEIAAALHAEGLVNET
jgi:hypothetical protein